MRSKGAAKPRISEGKSTYWKRKKRQPVQKRASEKNLSRRNKMLSVLYLLLSEKYCNSEGVSLKELMSGLSPPLSDWSSTAINLSPCGLTSVTGGKATAVFSPVRFAVGEQLARFAPCSSTGPQSRHLLKRNGERQMANPVWLGHLSRSRDTWGPVAGSVPDLLGDFSQVCPSPCTCISLYSIAETVSAVPDRAGLRPCK